MKLETLKTIASGLTDLIVAEETKIREARAQLEDALRDAFFATAHSRGLRRFCVRLHQSARSEMLDGFFRCKSFSCYASCFLLLRFYVSASPDVHYYTPFPLSRQAFLLLQKDIF